MEQLRFSEGELLAAELDRYSALQAISRSAMNRSTLAFCLCLLFAAHFRLVGPLQGQDREAIQEVVLHPIVNDTFVCAEHAEGELTQLGDALGKDCMVIRMDWWHFKSVSWPVTQADQERRTTGPIALEHVGKAGGTEASSPHRVGSTAPRFQIAGSTPASPVRPGRSTQRRRPPAPRHRRRCPQPLARQPLPPLGPVGGTLPTTGSV